MKINILNVRIKRNKVAEIIGVHYKDINSEIVNELNKDGKTALFGIQRKDKVYTIIGEEYVYYSTKSGTFGEIPIDVFLNALQVNGINKGKKGDFEYIFIENEYVWLNNNSTMVALWNILLWINGLIKENS
jgi:hypothetical protein